MRVMIVEDNLIAREMLKEFCDQLGHEVVAAAEDLSGALAAYREHRPDVVTMDLSLAKEDGLTILKALRQAAPEARVVIVSGNCQERIRQECIQAGAAELLPKPIELAALQACLDRVSSHGNSPSGPESHPPAH